MIWIILVAIIVILDRAAKLLILGNVGQNQTIPVIDGFFNIVHTENTGAALGILQNGRIILVPVTIIAALVMGYIILFRTKSLLLKTSLSLILGGALGNLIDRVLKGRVIDFLDFQFGSWHFWTFNIADIFIVIGTILLAYYMLFIYEEAKVKAVNTNASNQNDEKLKTAETVEKVETAETSEADKTNGNGE